METGLADKLLLFVDHFQFSILELYFEASMKRNLKRISSTKSFFVFNRMIHLPD